MPSCKNCQYFVPHQKQTAAHTRVYGHCTVPRVKIRHPDAEICLRFTPNTTKNEPLKNDTLF